MSMSEEMGEGKEGEGRTVGKPAVGVPGGEVEEVESK